MAAVAAVLVTLGIGNDAYAGGYGLIDMGIRRAAMGVTIGRPDDPSAAMHNPAGLALLSGTRFYMSMGYSGLSTEFRLGPWEQSDTYITDEVQSDGRYPSDGAILASAVIPMLVATHEIIPDKLVVGAAAYVANATGSRPGEGKNTRYHLIEGYIVAPVVSANVAYRVNDKFVIGASAGAMYARLHGKRNLYPIIGDIDATPLLGGETELTLDGSDWVPSWQIGTLIQPTERLSFGANLVGRANATMEGDVEVVTTPTGGAGDTFMGTQKTDLLIPWALHTGVAYDVTDKVELGADFRYWLYRQYDEQRTDLTNLLFLQELVTPKNYNDSWQLSGGVRLHDLEALPGGELMLGAHFDQTPAPAETVTLDQPTFSHAGLHSGVRWSLSRYRLGLAYQYNYYFIPDIDDSLATPPLNASGSANAHIVTMSLEATFGTGAN